MREIMLHFQFYNGFAFIVFAVLSTSIYTGNYLNYLLFTSPVIKLIHLNKTTPFYDIV